MDCGKRMERAFERAYKILEVYSLTSYDFLEPVGLKNAPWQ